MEAAEREPILVFGAGGHAQSVIATIEHGRYFVVMGLIVEKALAVSHTHVSLMGHPVLGGLEVLEHGMPSGCTGVALAIGDNAARARIGKRLGELNIPLRSVIHGLACIAPDAVLGDGCFIHGFAHVGPGAILGAGAIVSSHCTIGHGSRIGGWAHLTPGVRLGGDTRIGRGAFLGMGCAILPRISVGAGASVGANSVVHKNIADGAVVAGNPARTIRRATIG